MSRFVKAFMALVVASLVLSGVSAQNTVQSAPGTPPIAALITVSPPDAEGVVTISGLAGAVFPAAQVAIRNLYTEETVYTQAGVTGTFKASLYGPGNTPFWISPAQSIPNTLRSRPGSLPGGPGTIVYGAFPETAADDTPVTQVVIDGSLEDWEAAYSSAAVLAQPPIYALVNRDSFYLGFAPASSPVYAQIAITFSLDGALYSLALDPRQEQPAALRRIQPNESDLGSLAVSATQADAIEIRVPFLPINPNNTAIETATLERVQFLGADGAELLTIPVEQPVTILPDEADGIPHLNSRLGESFTRFVISGPVAQGVSRWTARGRINGLAFEPGQQVVMELDVTLDAPGLPEGLAGLKMLGQIGLQPVIGADGQQATGGLNSNNGWSDVLTPGGLAITNLSGDFILGESTVPAPQVIRQGSRLLFGLEFALTLPDDLPVGRYVPFFQGFAQVADGERFAWKDNGLFGSGGAISSHPLTRLPLVLSVGTVENGHLLWTLFQDQPSSGSRGVLADEDRAGYALSNRVRFDSPTYILPRVTGPDGDPIVYPIEPYLLNQMPNAYDTSAPPLVPFLFPGGRLSARVTRPNGAVDDLGSTSILQSQLSTAALDERTQFGAQAPVDVYRLTTLNTSFTDYVFEDYGAYTIALSGSLEDVWGNRYDGGGTYRVLIAEPLYLLPGVLPGTPFEVGDVFYPGLRVQPGAPADVTITARIYPLDGGDLIEHTITGQANRSGYFYPDAGGFSFDVAGEYVIDYEARYTDAEGKLWAASQRSAGVIADADGALVAHGRRGLDGGGAAASVRPAWFTLKRYLSIVPDAGGQLNYPYNSGDVAWVASDGQLNPVIQVQDRQGDYAGWLIENLPGYITPTGLSLPQAAAEDELPLGVFSTADNPYGAPLIAERIANLGYFYVSAVRPGVTARQFVAGSAADGLPLYWDWSDPYNQQPGVGISGTRLGDYLFLFGGAVLHNQAINLSDTAIYAAVAITISPDDTPGPRVFPPYRGEAGGPNGGALLVLDETEINMFFHPTGLQPGQVLEVGDTVAIAGQLAPALPSVVSVTVTAPDGETRAFEGTASSIGYFYQPQNDFQVEQAGVWTVDIAVRHEGLTSAGQIEPPPPTGGILGAQGGRFQFYVVLPETEPLIWNDTRIDTSIPPAFPYNFNLRLPQDWRDVQVGYTVTMPGYILDAGVRPASAGSYTYQYNPANLSRRFANLESNGQGDGPAASDVVALTFVITGFDANGRAQIQTRAFTVLHDRLVTFDG
ncbi:MAG: hypothetical protein HXY41_07290 [Chloroflexi bacterium]|nr:hypothetical protein [Chloroflexota bacterium]